MKIKYILVASWPSLSWIAKCCINCEDIIIYHGSKLETRKDWFCEAVWAGKFDEGDFDKTDLIAGSGGRLRQDKVYFVSSGSTVDRLHSIRKSGCIWVSNSLVCTLSVVGADIDPLYPSYYGDFYSIVDGLRKYKRDLVTSVADLRLTYFDNLKWDRQNLTSVEKPNPEYDFCNFSSYKRFLDNTMELFFRNAGAAEREFVFSLTSTLSTGYDSTTVSAIASEAGCRDVICFDKDHLGADDSGQVVAEILGLDCIRVKGNAWRENPLPEIPFLAANGMGEEVRFKAVESELNGCLLLTGYHGDKVWSMDGAPPNPYIVRGDPSGLGLSEFRLWSGFIHCPVPFWGVRQLVDIRRISVSPDMSKWDFGGDYSRPICRRICEERGISRNLFGIKKRNASVILHNYATFLRPDSFESYSLWIRKHWWKFLTSGKVPPLANAHVDKFCYRSRDLITQILKNTPGFWRVVRHLESDPTYLRKFVFPWAMAQAKLRYSVTDQIF